MREVNLSRRQALLSGAGLLAVATIPGCKDRKTAKGKKAPSAARNEPPPQGPAPTLGWTLIASGKDGPGPRSRHGLVYDSEAKAAVLFGGLVNGQHDELPEDTWELRGRKWTKMETPSQPPGRHRGAMVYLDEQKFSLLFGGQGRVNDFLGDSWAYSGGKWKKLAPKGAVPSPRCGHSMTYDPTTRLAVLFGGIDPSDRSLADTWTFDGKAWKEVKVDKKTTDNTPAARRYAAMAYDPDLKGCILHGGSEDDAGTRSFGDTWLFQDLSWKRLDKNFETTVRDDHGIGFHRGANRLVLLDGLAGERGILVREPDGWQPVEANPLHPRHQCSPLIWNDDLGGLLLHGGEVTPNGLQLSQTLLFHMDPPKPK